ncbi:MAG: Flp family type IVb pilin [Microthrixaceae bacterium]
MKERDAERGATVVEYAMAVALVLVVSIGAISRLQTSSKSELASDGTRVGSAGDNAYYPGASTTSTTTATTTTTTTPSVAVHPSSLTATPAASNNGSKWIANATVTVVNSAGVPVPGALVQGTWSSPTPSVTSSCTTTASGTCTLQRTDINDSKPTAQFDITAITGTGLSWTPSGGDATTVTVSCPGSPATCD